VPRKNSAASASLPVARRLTGSSHLVVGLFL